MRWSLCLRWSFTLVAVVWSRCNSHPEYKNWLTNEQISALVAPSKSVQDAFASFLSQESVTYKFTANKDMIRVTAPLSALEQLFEIEFFNYKHATTGRVVAASLGPYTVPGALSEHTAFVSGLVGMPTEFSTLPSKYRYRKTEPTNGDDPLAITPDVIRSAYGLSDVSQPQNVNNSVAVAEFQAQWYSKADLEAFFQKFVPNSNADKVYKVVGSNQPQDPGVEASLDIQYVMGVAPGVQTWFYGMASFNFFSDLTAWQAELQDAASIPFVHSISYGSQGNYPSESYRSRADQEYAKIGSRGVSIIYASGDSGAGCAGFGSLNPSYPATSEHVTSVGATRFQQGTSGPEAAVEAFLSGGGFSHYFTQPSFQKSAVEAYLASGVKFPSSSKFNKNNRATPDVAALGSEHFQVVNGGQTISVGGTSCAAPTFSAVITQINGELLKAGKNTLGPLNKWLYANADILTDITVGSNVCQGEDGGYQCAKGYDAVTGLGTPKYQAMLASAMSASN